jgi:multidrug efflux system outer membrane protein
MSAALLALGLSGCSGLLAPAYQRPLAPVPASWPAGAAYETPRQGADAAATGWRDFIVDARLRQLVDIALANNRDLRIAALNIEKARAQYGIADSALLPSISGTLAGSQTETAQLLTNPGQPRIMHSYSAGVGFSGYELDFFGRVQNLKNQVLEQYLQTEEARNAAQTALIAEVAGAYLTLAADQENLRLAQSTQDSQQHSFDLIQRRFQLGIGSQLDLSQAESSVDAARVELASYTGQVAQDQNALTLLLGAPLPASLAPQTPLESAQVFKDIPAGLSSEVLTQRPDIRAAEHVLKADNASIGAARAAFFPSITLNAAVGSSSLQLHNLFSAGSGTWSFVPQLNLPIFNGGLLSAQLDVAKRTRDIDVAQYEKTIQSAFREVADALALRGTVGQQLQAQQALTAANALSYRLANARYQQGVDGYLNVLDAQRALYGAQQKLISVKLAQQNSLVTLYKALGGGVQATSTQPVSE